MGQAVIQIVESDEYFEIRCPRCGKCVYQGSWHVTLFNEGVHYAVGDVLRCCVSFRCQAVFPSEEAAIPRFETVLISVEVLQSTKHLELIEMPPDMVYVANQYAH